MPRFQFEPRVGHDLDLVKAQQVVMSVCRSFGKPQCVFPIMKGPERITRGPNKGEERMWTGTNQPMTISFNATDKQAREVRRLYGDDLVFIRDRKTYFSV